MYVCVCEVVSPLSPCLRRISRLWHFRRLRFLPAPSVYFPMSLNRFVNPCQLKVRRMNILIYSSLWTASVGGVQSVTNTLARGLAEESGASHADDVEVTVATPTPANGDHDVDAPFRVVGEVGFLELLRLVWKSDIVHLAGPAMLPLTLAWLLRKKAVIVHHGYQSVCPDGSLVHFADQRVCCNSFASGDARDCVRCRVAKMGWLRGLISVAVAYPRLWLCRRVAANVAVSEHVKNRLELPRTTTIYNAPEQSSIPMDVDFPRSYPFASSQLRSSAPRFVFVGRLTSEKGVATLLHAAAELAAQDVEFRVRIIGDGPERARLAILAWALHLRDQVEFTGTLTGAALEAAVSGALAVVLPSVAEETAGQVAIEQMMRGRVVIAADIGGLGEIVGQAGLRFPPGDAPALTKCLRRVLDDAELCAALGRAARSRALEYFTSERMVDEHMELYCRILERPTRVRPPVRAPSGFGLAARHKQAS
jgi:glycosyltransferase involved in cell wall biosynthesis